MILCNIEAATASGEMNWPSPVPCVPHLSISTVFPYVGVLSTTAHCFSRGKCCRSGIHTTVLVCSCIVLIELQTVSPSLTVPESFLPPFRLRREIIIRFGHLLIARVSITELHLHTLLQV